MAVTELPISPLSDIGLGGGSFVQGLRSKRCHWQNSFFLPSNPNVSAVLMGAPGAVTGNSGATVTLSTGPGGSVWIPAGGEYEGGGIQQIYIQDLGTGPNGYVVSVNSIAPSFPDDSLPLAVLVLDAVGRIQTIFDQRPSYVSSAPDLGTGMTESVADPTKRASFQTSFYVPRTYALTPQIPQDLSLPSPGFLLGSGSVLLSGNIISTPTTYLSTAAKGGQLATGITQGYIDPTSGKLATRQTQTSGVFPNGSLPIFEATVDSVGLIRNLTDFRPSYI